MIKISSYIFFCILIIACAVSPTGRKQFIIMPSSEMNQMGIQAFDQMKTDLPKVRDKEITTYVQCVADAITQLPSVQQVSSNWEVVVFDEMTINAFALPGGKIGVYKGLLTVAKNQNQLATVMGHEVGHVLARHGNERVSQNLAIDQVLSLLGNWMASQNTQYREAAMTALGLGSQFGILLPFSRLQESEADDIGLDLMAKAGFNPKESITLWQNMGKAGGNEPPEFLSTHPSHETRIEDLNSRMQAATELYKKAQAAGKQPQCNSL